MGTVIPVWENRCWGAINNQRSFFDWLGVQLGYKQMDDWYNVTVDHIFKYGGKTLLSTYYSGSPSKALQKVYHEHNWMLWRFSIAPKHYWKRVLSDKEEQHRICDWLGNQLSVKHPNDWNRVSMEQIKQLVSFSGINSEDILIQTLTKMNANAFPKASQKHLVNIVREIFQGYGEWS